MQTCIHAVLRTYWWFDVCACVYRGKALSELLTPSHFGGVLVQLNSMLRTMQTTFHKSHASPNCSGRTLSVQARTLCFPVSLTPTGVSLEEFGEVADCRIPCSDVMLGMQRSVTDTPTDRRTEIQRLSVSILLKLLGVGKCLDLKPRKPQLHVGKKAARTKCPGALVTVTGMSAGSWIALSKIGLQFFLVTHGNLQNAEARATSGL